MRVGQNFFACLALAVVFSSSQTAVVSLENSPARLKTIRMKISYEIVQTPSNSRLMEIAKLTK